MRYLLIKCDKDESEIQFHNSYTLNKFDILLTKNAPCFRFSLLSQIMHSVMEMKKMASKMELCQKLRPNFATRRKAINNAKVKKENSGKWLLNLVPSLKIYLVPSYSLKTRDCHCICLLLLSRTSASKRADGQKFLFELYNFFSVLLFDYLGYWITL